MWIRNNDTGKWSDKKDSLSKDSYDSLKQDLQSVKLYSKCLSGSTYLPINNLDNIYDELSNSKIGYYINDPYSSVNYPSNGPNTPINSNTYEEFYNKYLVESAFSIKNLFTPTKLIDDQLTNYKKVDIATTTNLSNVTVSNVNMFIDGIRLKEGHRVLVKDQITEISLPFTTDPEIYFKTVQLVSKYYVIETIGSQIRYYYYNNQNGIYIYTNNRLVRESDIDNYKGSYKYSVSIKLGNANSDKQFHLTRLKDGYFPITGQNCEFVEKHNWVLRNRVDYHNIFDINYYDILHHDSQVLNVDGQQYSIPSRTIAVGDFGVIIDNQDKASSFATFSVSHIINNKYKVNINSISEIDNFYWVCGDEGTLLKVSKIDFKIERYELNETSNLTSVSFFGNLNGMVVGKFNTIYTTTDGGYNWSKLTYPDFDIYSYNKVIQFNSNQAYVGGEAGVFIEFNYTGGSWLAYKRKISKVLSSIDEYVLVDDINDMSKTTWVGLIGSTYSEDQSQLDFGYNLVYNNSIVDGYRKFQIEVDSRYFGGSTFSMSEFYIALQINSSLGSIYTGSEFSYNISSPLPMYNSFDIYQVGTTYSKYKFDINLPIDSNGNLVEDNYEIETNLVYNFNAVGSSGSSVSSGYFQTHHSFIVNTKKGGVLLICTNNENIISYDIDKVLTKIDNQFIYLGFSQSHTDIKTITRKNGNSTDILIGGDKIYKFNFSNFLNIQDTSTNLAFGTSSVVTDLYSNKLFTTGNTLYIAGNNSLLKYNEYINSDYNDLDPTFNDNLKSKLLFMDYDIASKLNFFDSDRTYRLPESVTFSTVSLTAASASLTINNITNEYNWLSYYKDTSKTFKYYSAMNNANVVEMSSTFSYTNQQTSITFSSSDITNNINLVSSIAPNISSSTQSRYIQGPTSISSTFTSGFRVFMYKSLIIFKTPLSYPVNIGDIMYITSNVIDCSLIVNRIENISGFKYIYCYSDFNDSIINSLKLTTLSLTNLNKYQSIDDLNIKFQKHNISIGYSLNISNNELSISNRFNNLTAYYNMQSSINLNGIIKNMTYKESFLNFGYSPTYNVLDFLSKIDSNAFIPSKKLVILPEYYTLPGNNGNTFNNSNLYVEVNVPTNKIIFGSSFKFHWESILIYTFVDIKLYSNTSDSSNSRLLITNKYYDTTLDGYVIEFHKKLEIPTINISNPGINNIDIISRNTLSQISNDLQLLNNIQRTSTIKSVQYLETFNNLENELKYKFPTDSYFKAFASDYDIREKLSSIIYTDVDNQMAMNILNIDREIVYDVIGTNVFNDLGNGISNKLMISINGSHGLKVGDGIIMEFNGGTMSSEELNRSYFGYQTVISVPSPYQFVTSKDFGINILSNDTGVARFIKKDPFLNYQPIDLFNLGNDKEVTRSIEIRPENFILKGVTYSIVDLDLDKYKFQFVDGLSLSEVNKKFSWLLEAEISNAVIGRDNNGLIWYSGIWRCGRWFGGTWISGTWISGDWYGGTWNSYNTQYKVISVQVDASYVDDTVSKWYNGRWFDGTWNGGTWYNGRRYSGYWERGNWYNGIWNDGVWNSGIFEGGIWVRGTWNSGLFNCNSKPSYWLDGSFNSGDFENGIWYNGQFGSLQNLISRFGTKSTNSRTSTWHGGRWINGEIHSYLNTDSQTGKPIISDIHKYTIWKTGTWFNGNWYGGIAYNIDFKNGIWHGGILEEIQVIGVSPILPATQSSNQIILNGIFKFNVGDEVWIIDDYTNRLYSPLGNNDSPMKYRINRIIEDNNIKQTYLSLNYNLSTLGITSSMVYSTQSNIDTGLRLVSHFKDSTWDSGIWTNGIFDGGTFNSGIWLNGVFNGTWGK